MPRKTERAHPGVRKYGTKSNYTPETLHEALEKVKSGVMSRIDASKLYKIPPVTLFYKLKEKHFKNVGRPTIFTVEEEESFKSHLLMMSDLGIPISMLDFRIIVRNYLANTNKIVPQFKDNMPGYEWGTLFLERHIEIKEKFAHKIPRKRAQVSREEVEVFFSNIKKEIEGVPAKNIYNMDESGFHDDPGKKKLLFRRDSRHPEIIKNSSKSCYTLIFCGNANGDMLPPFFVFKGKKLWSDWLFQAPPGSKMSVSQSGWIDQSIFEEWLENHFLPYVDKDEGKKILLCDNLSAHISPKALRLCDAHNVAFICLIPNSTHLLQPLDVGYFSSLKTAWRKVLDNYRNTSRGKKVLALPKSLFAQLIKTTLKTGEGTAADNIKAGFRSCGLYPFSPQTVLNKLPTYTSPTEVRESVAESFVNFIEEVRQSDLTVVRKARKFQLPVTAGKSVSAEEVEKYQENREKGEKKKDKGISVTETKKRGRPKGSTNKGTNKKKKISEQGVSSKREEFESVDSIEIESEPQEIDKQEQLVCAEIHEYSSNPRVTPEKSKNQGEKSMHLEEEKHKNRNKLHIQVMPDLETIEDYPLTEDQYFELGDQITLESHELPVVVEDYLLDLDGTLIKTSTVQNDEKPLEGSFCVFKEEGSFFPGCIMKVTDSQATLSVLEKKYDGGWSWPSKKDFCQIGLSQMIHVLKDEQVIRKGSKVQIEDDILFMEWGE